MLNYFITERCKIAKWQRKEYVMKKFKWIMGSILSLGMVATLALPVCAQEPTARSATDSTIPSRFISYTTEYNTDHRQKDTSGYIYLKNDAGFNLWVIAKASVNSANCMSRDPNNYYAHSIVPTGQYFLTNYVIERGYGNCYLNLTTATSGTSGYVKGAWSPDSVGSYPIIRPV